jgi:hypothetical protein
MSTRVTKTGNAQTTSLPFSFLCSGLPAEPADSVGIHDDDIRERAKFAQSQSLPDFLNYAFGTGSPAADPLSLTAENFLLRRELDNFRRELDEIKKRMPEEKVVVLRDITRDEAKREINSLFSSGRTLYYSDIAEELGLDLRIVVGLCQELEDEGKVELDDRV